MTLYDLFRARSEEHPDQLAVIFGDERITYRDLAGEVDRIARGLHARGIVRGDRVLSVLGNVPSAIAMYLAVGRLGAVYVPVTPGFRRTEGRFVLGNSRPRLAVVDAAVLDEFLGWTGDKTLDLVVFRTEREQRLLSPGQAWFDEMHEGATALPAVTVDEDSGALLCYTSGTTSNPKPVLHSYGSEVYNAQTYADVWELGPADRGVVCLPLAWVYGLSATTAALLVSGATVVLLDRFHPAQAVDAIELHRATGLWGTMSMYTKIVEVLREREGADLSTLRVVSNGGEPCPPPLVAAFEEQTGLQLLGSYATSEARPILVVRPGDRSAPKGTAGRLVAGAEIRLEGPDGGEVRDGETGHALVRCAGLMTEYYGEPELTAERMTADGWFRTGDLLQRDENGYYFVVGRESEMIIRSGVNIAPAEVESALIEHPGVADAAVIGVPDHRSGESVRAFVVAERGATPTEDEIRRDLEERLALYKVPQEFVFVEELPRTARGKLDRGALRAFGRRTLERN